MAISIALQMLPARRNTGQRRREKTFCEIPAYRSHLLLRPAPLGLKTEGENSHFRETEVITEIGGIQINEFRTDRRTERHHQGCEGVC